MFNLSTLSGINLQTDNYFQYTSTGNQFIGARDYAARTQEKHQFLPIPTKELDVNGKLEQNKYWQ